MWSTFRSASFKPVLTEEGKVEQKQCGCTDKDKCPFVSRLVEEMVLENLSGGSCCVITSSRVCVSSRL